MICAGPVCLSPGEFLHGTAVAQDPNSNAMDFQSEYFFPGSRLEFNCDDFYLKPEESGVRCRNGLAQPPLPPFWFPPVPSCQGNNATPSAGDTTNVSLTYKHSREIQANGTNTRAAVKISASTIICQLVVNRQRNHNCTHHTATLTPVGITKQSVMQSTDASFPS